MNQPVHTTHCDFHIGDNLFHLHFLRKLAAAYPGHSFVHSCHYHQQLREVVQDLPQITLTTVEERVPWSVNAWKNDGNFFGGMDQSPDYYEFYLRWFAHLAGKMGLESPLRTMDDLLFDYPALRNPVWGSARIDTLVINSQPCSGQWMAYAREEQGREFEDIIRAMTGFVAVTQPVPDAPSNVICTRDGGLTVTGIGHLSQRCTRIVMIGTGPAWPTMNAFNRDTVRKRLVLLHPERVNFPGVDHARNFQEVCVWMEREGLL